MKKFRVGLGRVDFVRGLTGHIVIGKFRWNRCWKFRNIWQLVPFMVNRNQIRSIWRSWHSCFVHVQQMNQYRKVTIRSGGCCIFCNMWRVGNCLVDMIWISSVRVDWHSSSLHVWQKSKQEGYEETSAAFSLIFDDLVITLSTCLVSIDKRWQVQLDWRATNMKWFEARRASDIVAKEQAQRFGKNTANGKPLQERNSIHFG